MKQYRCLEELKLKDGLYNHKGNIGSVTCDTYASIIELPLIKKVVRVSERCDRVHLSEILNNDVIVDTELYQRCNGENIWLVDCQVSKFG